MKEHEIPKKQPTLLTRFHDPELDRALRLLSLVWGVKVQGMPGEARASARTLKPHILKTKDLRV